MRWTHVWYILVLATVWSACSSDRWVHRFKTQDQLTGDYNTCERELLFKKSEGRAMSMYSNVNLDQERIGQCLQKKGWKKVEDK